jgi:hypothetical protein
LHPPSPHLITLLPGLAIRDFLSFQPFGPDHCEGAAIFADRKGFGPEAAPAWRATSVDGSTTSVVYKAAEKRMIKKELGSLPAGDGLFEHRASVWLLDRQLVDDVRRAVRT